MKRARSQAGFTLIEIMITVAIVGILATIATPLYIKYTYKARTVEASTNLAAIRTSQIAFKTNYDRYLNVRIEPQTPITGLLKTWPNLPASGANTAAVSGTGSFADIGFVPAAAVYYHYGCRGGTPGTPDFEAAVCEAASDINQDGGAALFQLGWRLDSTVGAPANYPLSGGSLQIVNWGVVENRTPGQY